MQEVIGDLWTYCGRPDTTIFVTTNGSVTSAGKAVMGRGCAVQARDRFPGIDVELGRKIRERGNIIHPLQDGLICSFPVKHYWDLDADLQLIVKSAARLAQIALLCRQGTFVLPRPGCGNGRLAWRIVKPTLAGLPDNVLVISPPITTLESQ